MLFFKYLVISLGSLKYWISYLSPALFVLVSTLFVLDLIESANHPDSKLCNLDSAPLSTGRWKLFPLSPPTEVKLSSYHPQPVSLSSVNASITSALCNLGLSKIVFSDWYIWSLLNPPCFNVLLISAIAAVNS